MIYIAGLHVIPDFHLKGLGSMAKRVTEILCSPRFRVLYQGPLFFKNHALVKVAPSLCSLLPPSCVL